MGCEIRAEVFERGVRLPAADAHLCKRRTSEPRCCAATHPSAATASAVQEKLCSRADHVSHEGRAGEGRSKTRPRLPATFAITASNLHGVLGDVLDCSLAPITRLLLRVDIKTGVFLERESLRRSSSFSLVRFSVSTILTLVRSLPLANSACRNFSAIEPLLTLRVGLGGDRLLCLSNLLLGLAQPGLIQLDAD